MRRRAPGSGEGGQILPVLGAFLLLVVAAGLVLVQVGGAARLSTEGQTAAAAAAIAGATNAKEQMEVLAVSGGEGFTAAGVNPVLVCAAAADYARRNDGTLTECRLEQFDVVTTVRSRTLFKPGTDDGIGLDREDARATSHARARVTGLYSAIPSALAGGGASGATSAAGGGGSGGGVSDGELRDLEEKAGVKAVSGTSLQTYGSKVTGLTEYMKVAILKAEALLKKPLVINSGFRSVAEQAAICASGQAQGGRCAPPGQSYHNKGLAIDVGNWPELARVASRAGLCQPFPAPGDDNVHFSPIDGVECGGRASPGGSGAGAFGGPGGLSSFVTFQIELVPYGDSSLPGL